MRLLILAEQMLPQDISAGLERRIAALAKAGLAAPLLGESFTSISMWVLTAYLTLGIVLNLISRSKTERLIMTPTVLILAALYFVLSLH